MLRRNKEMSGMKRRGGLPKMTQRVDQMKPQGPRVTQEMSRVPRIRNSRGTGTTEFASISPIRT